MEEKIYQIDFDYNYALADITESMNGANSLELSADTPEYLSSFKYDWITNESTIIPDCIIVISELLGGNEHFTKVIKEVMQSINLHPIFVGKKKYDIYTGMHIYKNQLNLKKSKVTKFSNGEIMDIISPVFLPGDYTPLFRIEEIPATYFCTEKLKKAVESNELKGLKFSECKVKSKSWF